MRTRHACLSWLPWLLAGCSSAAWSAPPPGVPTQWRSYQLFAGENALVLANDEDDAHEVHERATAAAANIAACLDRTPPRGLLIALAEGDPLPIADAAAYEEAMRRWHTSASPHGGGPSFELRQSGDQAVDIDRAVVMRMLAAPVPKDDRTLGLPQALLDASAFVAIVPTDACIADGCEQVVDAALDAQGVSWFELTLASLVVGHPATLMRKHVTRAVDAVLYAAWLAAIDASPGDVKAVLVRAGVLPPGANAADAPPPPSAEEVERARREFERKLRRPDGVATFFLLPVPRGPERDNIGRGDWTAVFEVGGVRDPFLSRAVTDAGKPYAWLQITAAAPGRDDAERFAALHRRHGEGLVLVCALIPEQAAALLAAYAYHSKGASVDEALDVARHYGADAYLNVIRDKLASEPRAK